MSMSTERRDENILELHNVGANYGPLSILQNMNMYVRRAEIVVLLGPNGAGKSTLLHTIVGLLPAVEGSIVFDKQPINSLGTEKIVQLGLTLVPEGKLLFPVMNVFDNLILATYHIAGRGKKEAIKKRLDVVFNLFPVLKERRRQRAETLSGGEQEMVAIGRGLMSIPKLLLLDEPSLGLAPLLVRELVDTLARLRRELGISILLAEQNVAAALRIADRGYVLGQGHVVLEGSSEQLRTSETVKQAYLGKSINSQLK